MQAQRPLILNETGIKDKGIEWLVKALFEVVESEVRELRRQRIIQEDKSQLTINSDANI